MRQKLRFFPKENRFSFGMSYEQKRPEWSSAAKEKADCYSRRYRDLLYAPPTSTTSAQDSEEPMTLQTQIADTLARAGWPSYSHTLRSGFTVVERSDGTVGVYYQHVPQTVRQVLESIVRDKLIWYKETIEDTLPVLCFFEEPTSDWGTEWLWCFPQEGQ